MKRRQVEKPFQRWGRIIFRYRWAVVATWFFLLSILIPFAVNTPALLKDNGFTPVGSPSQIGIQKLEENLGMSAAALDIVLESTTGENLTTSLSSKRISEELSSLRAEPFVKDMFTQLATHHPGQEHIVSISVLLNESTSDALQHFEEIKEAVPEVSGANTYITGNTAAYYEMNQAVRSDIVQAEMLGIPAALIILLFVFRSIPAAILPLIVGGTSVTITMGFLYFVVTWMGSLSNFVPNIVTMLGLALGIDYALFIVSRFREELKHRTVEDALAITCGTAGKAVVFSGLAVWVGLLAMNFIDLPIFRSLSIGGLSVVLISTVLANTMLLALLGILGQKINAWPISFRRGTAHNKPKSTTFWVKLTKLVMSYPVLITAFVTALLVATMIPISQMKLGIPTTEVLPYSYESRAGAELMEKAYDINEVNAIHIAVEMKDPYNHASSVQEIKDYMSTLRLMPSVKRVESYASISRGSPEEVVKLLAEPEIRLQIEARHVALDRTAVIAVVSEYEDTDKRTVQLVKDIRNTPPTGDMKTYVTGVPAYKLDIMERIEEGIPWVLFFIIILTYAVLLFAFRSIILPLKAVIMNLLSLGASMGVVVIVFQNGYGADFFQVSDTGSVFAFLPILIFCIVFGVSMDYEVFMLTRMKEAYDVSGDSEGSTAEGLQQTRGIITSAALILIVVVGAFILTDNEIMKAMGLGMTVAVILDVSIIRILLVPALMKLLGRANWWSPAWMFKRRR
ncbi:MAG TPA: MMPL family transporter [Paenibacillus sp.]|jgi:RND superfamily putative drug exporter